MNPAQEMQKAAQRLRTRAKVTTPGPWHCGFEIQGDKDVYGPEGQKICQDGVDWPTTLTHDAEWIALMSPEMAEALAKVLDATASVVYVAQSLNTEHYSVLAFARLVNNKVITPKAAQEAS